MKIIQTLFLFAFFISLNGFSQDDRTDSLLVLLKNAKEDTIRVKLLNQVSISYLDSSPEDALKYATQARTLAETVSYPQGLAYALKNMGLAFYMQGDFVQAFNVWNLSLAQFERQNDKKGVANMLSNLGTIYQNKGDSEKGLEYALKALKYAEQAGDTLRLVTVLSNISAIYINKSTEYDKALAYLQRALPLCEKIGHNNLLGTILTNMGEIFLARDDDEVALQYFKRALTAEITPYSINNLARVYDKTKDYTTAIKYHQQAIDISKKQSLKYDMAQSLLGLATVYSHMNETAKALEYFKRAEIFAKEVAANFELEKIYQEQLNIYSNAGQYKEAFKYQSLLSAVKDTLYNAEKDKKFDVLAFNFEIQKKQTQIDLLTSDRALKEAELKRQKTVKNSLIVGLSLVTLLVFFLIRIYRLKNSTNLLLDAQKKELEHTLSELKTTQQQLILSEKMASLGELTAGIAHEIQNPLNFVNNFSEVNDELLGELEKELNEGNNEAATLTTKNIRINGQKIIHHGKRADAIVKGMLQHSHADQGHKEPIDINALVDEYLRLSFHGAKARDKTFNANLKKDFDVSIQTINIIPKDIGKVMINLLNNAFYAVSSAAKSNGNEGYEPTVTVSTKKLNNKIEILVKDNGAGIPEKIKGKIFQPFFTTKPTGEGTGLGLSLCYDIIKSYGGEIKVESKEGEGTEFSVTLPV